MAIRYVFLIPFLVVGVILALGEVTYRHDEGPQAIPSVVTWSSYHPLPAKPPKPVSAAELRRQKRRQREEARQTAAAEKRAQRENDLASVSGDNEAYKRLLRIRREHSDWDPDMQVVVAKQRVRIGMTAEQAVASWGEPTGINRTQSALGEQDQYVYGDLPANYLYFDNGVLTTIQDSRSP